STMQSGFVHEDGMGGTFDDQGNEIFVIQMEVDGEAYPFQNVANFDEYTQLKPSERCKLCQRRSR
ncbi:hypothetical protein BD408DRAFT_342144, partial [Parasitella parasitica]